MKHIAGHRCFPHFTGSRPVEQRLRGDSSLAAPSGTEPVQRRAAQSTSTSANRRSGLLWRDGEGAGRRPASRPASIELDRLTSSGGVEAAAPTREVARAEAVAPAAAARPRMALLSRLSGEPRSVDPKQLLDAVLLRRWGEDHYDKNEWNKLVPGVVERVRMRLGTFNKLVGSDFETVRAHLADRPRDGSRHLLNQLARMKLLSGIGIDPASFMDGAMRRSFLAAGFIWEQLHTNVGRVFASAFAGAAYGMEFIPGHEEVVDGVSREVLDKAATLGKLAGQTVCSVVPTFILTPLVTGMGRSNTDVFENFALQHGFPALAPGLEKAAAMNPRVLQDQRDETRRARKAFEAIDWKAVYPERIPDLHALPWPRREAVEAMLGSAYKLYQVADTDYKRAMGSYKASAVGKAAGGLMNGLGAGVTVLSFMKRYDLAFFWSLGLIVLQPFSGLQDKNAMATYCVDAGVKWDWKSLVKAPYRNLPPGQLRPQHMDVAAARKRWNHLDDILVGAVKEVYKYQLSDLLAGFDESLQDLAALQRQHASRAGLGGEVGELRRSLGSQCEEIEGWRADIERFESRDPQQWEEISPRLGAYLDDTTRPLNKLKLGQREARTGRPGEVLSQVLQRYKQLLQDLPASFAFLYAAAKAMDALGVPSVACEAILAVGASDCALNTWQTRSDKAEDKRVLSKPLVAAAVQEADRQSARIPQGLALRTDGAEEEEQDDQVEEALHARYAHAGRWALDEPGPVSEAAPLLPRSATPAPKTVPLVGESGYRAARPGWGERGHQLLRVVATGVFSGPRALGRLASTRTQRKQAHQELKAVQRALEDAGFPLAGPACRDVACGNGTSLAATRARLARHAVVTACLLDQARQVEAAAAAKAGDDAAVPALSQ